MESRRKLGSVSNGLLACTWHYLELSFSRGVCPKAGLEILSPAFPNLTVFNQLWWSRVVYWLWAEQQDDLFPVLRGVSLALRTHPPESCTHPSGAGAAACHGKARTEHASSQNKREEVCF